ncbi:MAG: hypothetical protein RIQ60_161 [Pseudomonadota bacterium]|jgi:diguanylate cyclase (GGDEF)-like protein
MYTTNTAEPRACICIADDDANTLASLTAMLESDHQVLVARNGLEALALVRRELPDLVLLDIDMPGMDGLEVCRKLRRDPLTASVPVVFLTQKVDEASELEALHAGASDFIVKPPRHKAVMARLQQLVRRQKVADQAASAMRLDALTGLSIRANLLGCLHIELLQVGALAGPLSLLLLNLNDFRAYNQHYGQRAGDRVLTQVAELLKAAAQRSSGMAARLGGDVFGLLMPDTPADAALAIAQALQRELAALALPHLASPVAAVVSARIGLATTRSDAMAAGQAVLAAWQAATTLADEMLARAEQALADARGGGQLAIQVAPAGVQ